MSDILKLRSTESEATYTVYVSRIGSDKVETIDDGLGCSAAQQLCYDEEESYGSDYSVWMEKE